MHVRLKKVHYRLRRQKREHLRRFRRLRAHPVVIPIATFATLLSISLLGWWLLNSRNVVATNAYVVIISHDHAEQTVPSNEPTVGALLEKLHLTLNEGDVVEPAKTTKINQDDFRINIYRALPVEVIDGSQHTFAFSAATTPRSIARQAGIATYAEDEVTTQPVTNFLSQQSIGQQVVINRASPVNLNLYGTPTVVRTHAKTVAQFVEEKRIKLSKDDQVVPALTTPISDNQQIFVIRNGTKIESVTETIPTPVQVINDPSLAFGTSAVRQQGSPGQQVTTYQDNLQNGIIVSRTIIQKVVTKAAVNQIEVHGSAVPNPDDVKGLIVYWAQQYGVDPNYLLGVAKCESNFHTNSVNPSGASGLFQYKDSTWASYSALAGVGGASIWDAGAQAHTTAWAFAHGKSSAWSCA